MFALQVGPGRGPDSRRLGGRFPIEHLCPDAVPATWGFVDTAAVLMNLDLVVTVDSSVAHLAGALDVPVWVALSGVSDWRWGVGKLDTPWYPTMGLFRQRTLGDWDELFGRVARALAHGTERLRRGRERGPT